jgi:glycosyltransferase involved in cell wall biosynthesis
MASAGQSIAALVIPALNEEAVIAATLGSIPAGIFETVIVADNGSTDATARIAREHGALVACEPRRGYGAACLAAIRLLPPGTVAVVFMQADGSEDPAEAPALLAPIFEGRADLVIGSRVLGGAEPGALLAHQRLGNWLAVRLIRFLYGYDYSDLGAFRAIRVESLRSLGMRDQSYGWTVEMQVRALKRHLRITEIPVRYRRRQAGINKVSGNLINSVKAGSKIVWTVVSLACGLKR